LNTAKFGAAMIFCKKQGLKFTVLTEDQIWKMSGKK
jgi:hypothetical protein